MIKNSRVFHRVLDVGCGVGGPAMHMAERYGALVTGVDLSDNMVALANENRSAAPPGVKYRVQFHKEDATAADFPDDFFDVVHSREAFFHIADKVELCRRLYRTLKPGGTIMITDYTRGNPKQVIAGSWAV